MKSEWLAVEHHRIHIMELWPDGPRRRSGLTAARSALDSLARNLPKGFSFTCTTCASRVDGDDPDSAGSSGDETTRSSDRLLKRLFATAR
jgi:hypothetical protein